jgi:hypothetical protein
MFCLLQDMFFLAENTLERYPEYAIFLKLQPVRTMISNNEIRTQSTK